MILACNKRLKIGDKCDQIDVIDRRGNSLKIIKQPVVVIRESSREEFIKFWTEQGDCFGHEFTPPLLDNPAYFYKISTD